MQTVGMTTPPTYRDHLLRRLDELEQSYLGSLGLATIKNNNWPDGFIGFAHFSWAPSSPESSISRMEMLRSISDIEPKTRLLFPHPTPDVASVLKDSFGLLKRWAKQKSGDHSIPPTIAAAQQIASEHVAALRSLFELLPEDSWPVRLVVDTNTLLDEPDVAVYKDKLGGRYLVHLLPIVLGEIDELKRSGRNEEVREAARRADRRLKSLRDNGDVRAGARVSGDVFAIFEHAEPRGEHLPDWLDLQVPDDRLVASALLMQSDRPGSRVYVATSDLNLQTKLAAAGLPFIEPRGR